MAVTLGTPKGGLDFYQGTNTALTHSQKRAETRWASLGKQISVELQMHLKRNFTEFQHPHVLFSTPWGSLACLCEHVLYYCTP